MGELVLSSQEVIDVEVETEEDREKDKRKKRKKENDGSSEVVRWEAFLPRMVLRVLLVEADDSTRQIIAALLRKCSYRVAAVPDGLMAWETLKGRPQNIDIILTEVELPSISGFALLTLVMEHDACKNIPVIMMSSQDSISMVLKCMLKGAADFLIKPVRRNELRNLWQHVWRRQTLSGGHVHQSLPVSQPKDEATSGNNESRNQSSEHANSAQKDEECREKESDVPGLKQVKCSSASNLSNNCTGKHVEHVKSNKTLVLMECDTGGKFDRLGSEVPHCCQASKSTTLRLEEGNASVTEMSEKEGAGAGSLDRDANISSIRIHDCNDEQVEPSNGAIDLIGGFSNHLSCTYENSGWIDDMHKLEFAPQLELSLTRYCPTTSKNQEDNERQTLNHCNASAFSRYNNRKSLQPPFPALAGNCNELKERETKSHEQLSNQLSEDTIATDDQHGTAPNNSQGNTSSPATGHSEQVGLASVSGVRFDNICAERNHGSQTIFHTKSCLTPHMGSLRLAYLQEQSPFALGSSDYSSPDNHESEQGYLRSGKTIDYSMDQIVHEPSDVESTREIKEGSPVPGQSTCSTLCNGVASGNNGSAYGSICPDGHVTSAAAVEKGSAPDGRLFIHDVFNHRSSQREAALTKFRLKRKDRCYEKKVRYQSRKTLAEQRPRVKGQFVRQVQNDAPATEAAVCPDTH